MRVCKVQTLLARFRRMPCPQGLPAYKHSLNGNDAILKTSAHTNPHPLTADPVVTDVVPACLLQQPYVSALHAALGGKA